MRKKLHTKEEYTAVGKLLKPFRLKGEVKTLPMSFDFFRYKDLEEVLLFDPSTGQEREVIIDRGYDRDRFWYLHFEGINSPEEIGEYRNWEILIPDSERPELPEGMYYFSELPGLKAIDMEGNELGGKLLEARENPANNILIFRIKGKEIVAPWIEECVGDIDLEAGTIELNLDYLKEVYDL